MRVYILLLFLGIFLAGCIEDASQQGSAEIDSLESEIDDLKLRIEMLEENGNSITSNAVVETAQNSNKGCSQDFERTKSDFMGIRTALKEAQDDYTGALIVYNKKEKSLEFFEEEYEDIRDNDTSTNSQIEDAKKKVDDAEKDLEEKKEELDSFEDDMADTENEFEKFRSELKMLVIECGDSFDFNDDQCGTDSSKVEDDINDIDDKIDDKEIEIEDADDASDEDKADDLKEELDELNAEKDALEEKLNLVDYRCSD